VDKIHLIPNLVKISSLRHIIIIIFIKNTLNKHPLNSEKKFEIYPKTWVKIFFHPKTWVNPLTTGDLPILVPFPVTLSDP